VFCFPKSRIDKNSGKKGSTKSSSNKFTKTFCGDYLHCKIANFRVTVSNIFFKWYYDQSGTMIKIVVYCLQISVLVPEIFKFEKCVKYANEMTDDIIHSTQFYIRDINRDILVNLQCRLLKLGRPIGLQEHTYGYKNYVPMATHSSPVPAHLISICQ